MKTIPGFENQVGLTMLLSTSKFWSQVGYNSFYGISGGLGGRFFKRLSIGGLIEFGTSNDLKGFEPTIELVTAYHLGKQDLRRKVVGFSAEKEEEFPETILEKLAQEEKTEKSAQQQKLLDEQRERDSLAAIARQKEKIALEEKEQRVLDSIAEVKRQEAILAAEKTREAKRQDSISNAKLAEVEVARKKEALEKIAQKRDLVTPEKGERYEETTTEDGLQPGFYLIANVFGTKKYYEAFMQDLTRMGLAPKSFLRSLNKYNYVYLKRYNTIQEARKARDSKFNGRYPDKTWIFRVGGRK